MNCRIRNITILVNEGVSCISLKLLIEKCPEAARHADDNDRLPIHLASGQRSREFFRLLVEAYPGSVRMIDGRGELPLHQTCSNGSVSTIEY